MKMTEFIAVCGAVMGLATASLSLHYALRFRAEAKRDAIRFRFFAARDRLYMAAANGLIPVESEAFIGLRDALNDTLRDDALMGATEFAWFFLTPDGDNEATKRHRETILGPLSEQGRAEFRDISKEMVGAIIALAKANSRIFRTIVTLEDVVYRLEKQDAEAKSLNRLVRGGATDSHNGELRLAGF